ncbi:hypothetical protein LEP1GSC085_2370 [Leptospira interrogans str. L0996]|nr:hypothetical protein LEP1GSC085_2370 [Leptospira interrogans str. L0996]
MTDLDQAVLLPADEYILSEEQNITKSSDSSLHLPEIPEGNYGIYYEELIPLVRENHGFFPFGTTNSYFPFCKLCKRKIASFGKRISFSF